MSDWCTEDPREVFDCSKKHCIVIHTEGIVFGGTVSTKGATTPWDVQIANNQPEHIGLRHIGPNEAWPTHWRWLSLPDSTDFPIFW